MLFSSRLPVSSHLIKTLPMDFLPPEKTENNIHKCEKAIYPLELSSCLLYCKKKNKRNRNRKLRIWWFGKTRFDNLECACCMQVCRSLCVPLLKTNHVNSCHVYRTITRQIQHFVCLFFKQWTGGETPRVSQSKKKRWMDSHDYVHWPMH